MRLRPGAEALMSDSRDEKEKSDGEQMERKVSARRTKRMAFEEGCKLGRAHGVDITLCRILAWAGDTHNKTAQKYIRQAYEYAKAMEYPGERH